MRLIRLTSSDPNAIFENHFNADIKVNPQSKVALKSLSMEVALSDITIDSDNDTIEFQVSSVSGTKSIQLDHDTYDNITYPSLLNDMNENMNEALTTTGVNDNAMIGLEIKNFISTGETKFAYGSAIDLAFCNCSGVGYTTSFNISITKSTSS